MSENVETEKSEQENNTTAKPEAAEPEMSEEESKDVEDNKVMGILAYIIFFIPLLAAKESKFAMYHANQGLLNFLLVVAVYVVGMIPLIGWLIILPLGSILTMVLAVIGIINAAQGKKKPLPMIGKYQLIK